MKKNLRVEFEIDGIQVVATGVTNFKSNNFIDKLKIRYTNVDSLDVDKDTRELIREEALERLEAEANDDSVKMLH